MSYILDALRKSERERQQTEPLVLNPVVVDAIELPRRRLGIIAGISMAALGAVAMGTYWILSVQRHETEAKLTASPMPVSSVPKNLQTRPGSEPVSVATAPTTIRPAPELKPSPFTSAHPPASVRDLATEARVKAPERRLEQPSRTEVPAIPVMAAVAADAVRFLRAMPPEFQHAIPDLTVTIHIYAPREADRILYINNRQYHVGDHIRDDIVVEDIVQDGAVLSYRGQRFKLPRPT